MSREKRQKPLTEIERRAQFNRTEELIGPISSEHHTVVYQLARFDEAWHEITQSEYLQEAARDESLAKAFRAAYLIADAAADILRLLEAEIKQRRK